MKRVPGSIRKRFPKTDPYGYDFPRYVPSANWQEMVVEIPLPLATNAQVR